jgi:uncharacterized membrane protein YbhN (UPF0104 family)
VVTLLFLGLAVYILLPQIATLRESLAVLRALRPWAVALAVLAQMLSYIGSGYLLHAVARLVESPLPVGRGALINVAAQSVGVLGSGNVGSGAAVYRWMRKFHVRSEGALLAGWLPFTLITSVQAVFALFGVAILFTLRRLSVATATAFLLAVTVLAGLIGGVFWSARDRTLFTERLLRLSRHWARIRRTDFDRSTSRVGVTRLYIALHRLRLGGWRGPALGALLYVVFDLLTLAALFRASGFHVHAATVLAGYGLPLVLGKLTVLPGGIGIVEGAMAALYEGLAVPRGTTVVVILTYRVISFWLPLLVGLPLAVYFRQVEPPPRPQD